MRDEARPRSARHLGVQRADDGTLRRQRKPAAKVQPRQGEHRASWKLHGGRDHRRRARAHAPTGRLGHTASRVCAFSSAATALTMTVATMTAAGATAATAANARAERRGQRREHRVGARWEVRCLRLQQRGHLWGAHGARGAERWVSDWQERAGTW